MRQIVSAFAAGLIFGLGLIGSGMINPAKVLNFLDLFGQWDPSLALVMGGALAVGLVGHRFILKMDRPVLADAFHLPTRSDIDLRLVGGAVLFGVGWGLAGFCPGPAITGAGLGLAPVYVFLAAMLGAMALYRLVMR
jgi:uncharacterized membrane protein YedE/YeeE